jgi:hypothetical protein
VTAYAASIAGGNPLTEYQLAKRFSIPRSQARKIAAPAPSVRSQGTSTGSPPGVLAASNGHSPEGG